MVENLTADVLGGAQRAGLPHVRSLVERLAVALQAAVLVEYGDPSVAKSFMAARLPPADSEVGGSLMLCTHNLGSLSGSIAGSEQERLVGRLRVC